MRYSIIGATVEQVRSVGGTDIKVASRTGIIFANLTPEQVNRLRGMGCQVEQLGRVQAMVMPPAPVAGVPTYTAEQLVWATGLEQLRSLISPPLHTEEDLLTT